MSFENWNKLINDVKNGKFDTKAEQTEKHKGEQYLSKKESADSEDSVQHQ